MADDHAEGIMEHEPPIAARQLTPPLAATRRPVLGALQGPFGAPRSVVTILAGLFFLLALAGNLLIVVGSVPNARGLWLGGLATLLPTIVYAALVLSLDRYEREPWRNLLGAFAWGAVIATLSSIVLSGIADGLLSIILGPQTGDALTLTIGAPLIEESVKGLALLGLLLLYRDEFDGVLDGLIYGALIGLGFAMTENILYLGQAYIRGGLAGFGQLFIAREIFGGLGHALYTGTIGAAVGWARVRYGRGGLRFFVPVAGWALAVAQHSIWNLAAATLTSSAGASSPLLGVVAEQTAFFITPGLCILYLIAVRSGRTESRILQLQLADEVGTGVLTPREYAILSSRRLRHLALLGAFRRGGLRRWTAQQQFFQAAAELALCKHHESQGEHLPAYGYCLPKDDYRARLAALRSTLATTPTA
jgi:RsiW-degrading membrane proteinase PrsW (M82 family)